MRRAPKSPVRISHLSSALLMATLYSGAHTLAELAEESGLHPITVGQYVRALRKQGICYIAGWSEDTRGRLTRAEYRFGAKPDVARPPARSTAQRSREQRQRRNHMRVLHAQAGVVMGVEG